MKSGRTQYTAARDRTWRLRAMRKEVVCRPKRHALDVAQWSGACCLRLAGNELIRHDSQMPPRGSALASWCVEIQLIAAATGGAKVLQSNIHPTNKPSGFRGQCSTDLQGLRLRQFPRGEPRGLRDGAQRPITRDE